MRHPGIVIALQTWAAIMKVMTTLLAGTVIPTLVLLVQPAHAESASGIVVAQAQPENQKGNPRETLSLLTENYRRDCRKPGYVAAARG